MRYIIEKIHGKNYWWVVDTTDGSLVNIHRAALNCGMKRERYQFNKQQAEMLATLCNMLEAARASAAHRNTLELGGRTMRVRVYRNTRTGEYSITNQQTGRLLRRAGAVLLGDAIFRVSASGRRTITGNDYGKPMSTEDDLRTELGYGAIVELMYKPGEHTAFVREDTGAPVQQAETLWLTPGGIFAHIEGLVCGE